MITSRYPNYFL